MILFANKCDLFTDVTESFIAGARMEQLCRDLGFIAMFVTSGGRERTRYGMAVASAARVVSWRRCAATSSVLHDCLAA